MKKRKLLTSGLLGLLIGLLLSATAIEHGFAQPFSNSWIQFGNTYYKFKIGQSGVYRISKSQLDAIGMGIVTGSQFAVYREGQEVPIYTSTTGSFGSSDYIELYAAKADGKIDTKLYLDPSYQPNTDVNLISDTAYYFLTFNNNVHQRLPLVSNTIPSPAPSPSPYCMATSIPLEDVHAALDQGRSYSTIEYYYSSDYDLGEGYAYNNPSSATILNIATPGLFAAGPMANLQVVFAGQSVVATQHHTYVTLNGTNAFDTTYDAFKMVKRKVGIAAAQLSSNNNQIAFSDVFNFQVLGTSIIYPRTYNFSGNFSTKAAFQIPAGERYLEITGFNTSGQTPRLYDLTNNKIYSGIETGGVVKFYLDPSAGPRDAFLSSAGAISNVPSLVPVVFRDYANSANQGDYIILSHKSWINASPGYINDFKNYRSSITGGSYHPVVVDVSELYDQFGYGYEYHPSSVKDFIAYAQATWSIKPRFLFIIGRGHTYNYYRSYLATPGPLAPVPTWGYPGSDNLFSSFNNSEKPTLATGRLSAWSNDEVGLYLEKVKVYEEAIKPLAVPTVEHEFWKKKALHVAGSPILSEQNALVASLNVCATILADTLIGGVAATVRKTSTDPVDQGNNYVIDSLMNKGLRFTSFYGHGAASGFDFNLNSPDQYHSKPKYPVFSSFACEVAHIFGYASAKTVSENYINSVSGGSIAMIAANNFGWTGYLDTYMQNLYRSWSYRQFGKTLGEQYQANLIYLKDNASSAFMDIHIQSMLFQGDPALATYSPEKPDFAVEENGLSSNPANVNTTVDTFTLKAVVYSLGRTTRDSVLVRVQHTLPGANTVVFADSVRLPSLLSSDTVSFRIPVDPNRDVGLNNYTVMVDAAEKFDELSEANNQATLQIFIYSQNLQPVYPPEFAIVHDQGITLKASTLNAFAPMKNYRLSIDTTESFDSPLLQSTQIASSGGVIKWKPVINYKDSVVYYWRAAPDELVNGAYAWSNSSFIYLAGGSEGWNQSHYFQYKKNEPYFGLELPASNRRFRFSPVTNVLKVEDKVINPSLNDYFNVGHTLNDQLLDSWGCGFSFVTYKSGSVQVLVIDSTSGKPWTNTTAGLYGSVAYCGSLQIPPQRYMFEFLTDTRISRESARAFIESIPAGNYVMIKNLIYDGPPGTTWDGKVIDDWKTDTQAYGPGNSLYHAIKNLGFDQIDQFTYKRVFAFFRKKGDSNFPVTQALGVGASDKIQFEVPFFSYPDTATMQTSLVGPAKEWQTLKWRTSALDNPANDSPYVAVYGVDTFHHETLLYSGADRDVPLSFISAVQYPNLKLKWFSVDNISRTSPYLDYWRVLYSPVPEAALNAAAHLEYVDSLNEGQQGKIRIAIENLTPLPMDSMLVNFKIIDANNIKHDLASKRFRKLAGNDTLIASLDFNPSTYHGKNFLFLEANPNNDQAEQYHPNNLGYLDLFVNADKYNPLMDVTFDGVHILDKDIVSAKPFIKVQMRDENKFMPLNDTALMNVQLLYPNQSTPVQIPMDGTICKFFPADTANGHKNESRVEFRPTLNEDGQYKLIVSGRDKVGNQANNALKYEINFTVENKPSITNVLNYPNPFSTATQFIFTMTGSEIPSQFKIQVLTVTGKVVREIKKYELGDLHIGRNITDYRWDGKDEFGQMLGNGVYLYRVVTSIRGESIEQRKNTAVDKYFKNGYGKLYIMR
ncbi:putative type IX secretion system sortase PorU2 [Taibaiella koreensis]|uniref:putative type IX secretion system sortase PorU2 n=1 Tax=Taibaiella koreensis TaxID=1268548 RepID=UPI0013C2C714|nr:C25 family cysteine peptidase [Taibaiella koreensis]